MTILWRLLLGHFLADFTFQSNWVNKLKRESALGMMVHVGMHPLFYILLTFPYLKETWVHWNGMDLNGIVCIALITITHYIEDYWRVYTIKRFKTPDNTLYLIWDQVIHLAIIFIFVGINPAPGPSPLMPEIWPVLGILAIGATHFSVVLVYFIENDIKGLPYPASGEKYLAIGERLTAFLCLLFISAPWLAWLFAFVALAGPRFELSAPLKARRLPNMGWGLGSLIALICGFLGRMLYLS